MSNELPNTWTRRFAWTLLATFAFCPVLNPPNAQTISSQPFVANDRLQLLPITHTLKVAEPNEIPLHISDTNVRSIVVDWGIYRPGSPRPEYAQESRSPEYKLLPGPNGTSIINFAPSVLGKLSLGIGVFFKDGGFARKDEDVEAVVPDRSPEKFIFEESGHPWNANRIYATVDSTSWLNTVAFYPGFLKPIHIPAANVSFRLLNDAGKEPLQLDSTTGKFKPVSPGRTLIQADFAGLSTFTCILIFPSLGGGSVDDCHDLLPPGKSLPTQPKFERPKIRPRPSPLTNN